MRNSFSRLVVILRAAPSCPLRASLPTRAAAATQDASTAPSETGTAPQKTTTQNAAQGDDDDFTGCREFACIDPEASCVDDDDITAVMVENCEWAAAIGNGYCNQGNNKAECGYDGGDCCACTCVMRTM